MKRDPRLKRSGERCWTGRPMRTPHLHPVPRRSLRLQAALCGVADACTGAARDLRVMAYALAGVSDATRRA